MNYNLEIASALLEQIIEQGNNNPVLLELVSEIKNINSIEECNSCINTVVELQELTDCELLSYLESQLNNYITELEYEEINSGF